RNPICSCPKHHPCHTADFQPTYLGKNVDPIGWICLVHLNGFPDDRCFMLNSSFTNPCTSSGNFQRIAISQNRQNSCASCCVANPHFTRSKQMNSLFCFLICHLNSNLYRSDRLFSCHLRSFRLFICTIFIFPFHNLVL